MSKKMIVWDFIAAILIIIEIIVVNLIMKKIGMIAYILLDALAIAAILFVVNYISHKMSKKGNMKTSILNSIILVLVYLTISAGYGKTSYGIQANQNLNMMSMSENQIDSVEEEGMEIVLSDADTSSQILNYGFYLVVAFIGGQVGIRLKNQKEVSCMK